MKNIFLFTLLFGLGLTAAIFSILSVSTLYFFVLEFILNLAINYIFVYKFFKIGSNLPKLALLSYDIFVITILAIISISIYRHDLLDVSDYLISVVGFLGIAFALVQAVFIRIFWNCGNSQELR